MRSPDATKDPHMRPFDVKLTALFQKCSVLKGEFFHELVFEIFPNKQLKLTKSTHSFKTSMQ